MNRNVWLKKFPYFWVIYGALLVAFTVFLIWGAGKLKAYLTAFEKSQPIHFAEAVYEEYFSDDNWIPALEKAGYAAGDFETLEATASVLSEMKEGKEMAFYSASELDGELRYNVVLTDPKTQEPSAETGEIQVQGIPSTKVATIYLKKSEKADEFGFSGYDFTRLEMFVKPEKQVKVSMPSTSKLFVNGKEVTSDFVVEETGHQFNDFLPDGVEGIKYLTYQIGDLYVEPQLSVLDQNGAEQTLVFEEELGAFKAGLCYSEELKEAHSDRIMTGMKEFAKYMQNDGRINLVSRYFDTASMFYRNIAYNLSQFVWDHNGYEFKNEVIEDFYQFDENTFCCHVSFDHVLKLRGREDYVDAIDMIVFAKKKGNAFYIYDRIVQ